MDTKEKVFLGIIVGILGGVVVFSLTSTQGGGLSFGILYAIVSGVLTILILYLVFFLYPAFHKDIQKWKNTPKLKNITLDKDAMYHDEFRVKLGYKEWRRPRILIDDSKVRVLPDGGWISKFSVRSVLEKGKEIEIPFIRWYPSGNYFVIPHSDYPDDQQRRFGVGEYNFHLAVVYGYSSWQEGLIKRFKIPVSYDSEHGITLGKIKHDD